MWELGDDERERGPVHGRLCLMPGRVRVTLSGHPQPLHGVHPACTHSAPTQYLPFRLLLPRQAAKGAPEGQAAAFSEQEVEQMEILWEKVRLQLAFAAS